MYDFARRVRQLLEPEHSEPHRSDHDGLGNQERLARLRALLPACNVEAPDIDFSTEEGGLHVTGSLGAVQVGDTRVAGPSGTAHLGAWEDEQGLQQGVSVETAGVTVDTPTNHAQVFTSRARAGMLRDEDGMRIGADGRYGVVRAHNDEGADLNVLAGDVEGGISNGDDGMAVGIENDHQVVGLEAPGFQIRALHTGSTARLGENGAEVSVAANLLDGGNDVGSVESRPDRVEHRVEGGLSVGDSAGLRARWGGDGDGDGYETVGAGFDAGPFTADLYSEDFDSAGRDLDAGRTGHPITE